MGNKAARRLTSKEEAFAAYVATGESQAEGYRRAYARPNCKDQKAAEEGSRIAARPLVKARIAQLRAQTIGPRLLSVNDRLGKLANAMDFIPKTPGDRQALARLTEAYTKLAGGAQPEQQEITIKGDASSPLVVDVTINRAPVRERIAALRAAKETRG